MMIDETHLRTKKLALQILEKYALMGRKTGFVLGVLVFSLIAALSAFYKVFIFTALSLFAASALIIFRCRKLKKIYSALYEKTIYANKIVDGQTEIKLETSIFNDYYDFATRSTWVKDSLGYVWKSVEYPAPICLIKNFEGPITDGYVVALASFNYPLYIDQHLMHEIQKISKNIEVLPENHFKKNKKKRLLS